MAMTMMTQFMFVPDVTGMMGGKRKVTEVTRRKTSATKLTGPVVLDMKYGERFHEVVSTHDASGRASTAHAR